MTAFFSASISSVYCCRHALHCWNTSVSLIKTICSFCEGGAGMAILSSSVEGLIRVAAFWAMVKVTRDDSPRPVKFSEFGRVAVTLNVSLYMRYFRVRIRKTDWSTRCANAGSSRYFERRIPACEHMMYRHQHTPWKKN